MQIIRVTFDDDFQEQYLNLYNELLNEVRNPNGSLAVGNLFTCAQLHQLLYGGSLEFSPHHYPLGTYYLLGTRQLHPGEAL